MPNDEPAAEREAPIDGQVVVRTAKETGVDEDDLADALAVLGAELLGRHSEYEAEYAHVTVDGRRAYLVDEEAWNDLTDQFDIDGDLLDAARRAHTEQCRLLYDRAVESGRFDGETVGVVVGVDTAEEMV